MLSTPPPAQAGEAFSKLILKLFYWAPQRVVLVSLFYLLVFEISFLEELEIIFPKFDVEDI